MIGKENALGSVGFIVLSVEIHCFILTTTPITTIKTVINPNHLHSNDTGEYILRVYILTVYYFATHLYVRLVYHTHV